MFCRHCGESIPNDSTFCKICGKSTSETPDKPISPIFKEEYSPETRKKRTKAAKKTNSCVSGGCVSIIILFIVIGIIGSISDSCAAKKLERAVANEQFSTTAQIKAFMQVKEIECSANSTGWQAENSSQQDIVNDLYRKFTILMDQEQEAEALPLVESLLTNVPDTNYSEYIRQLNELKPLIIDESLAAEIEKTIEDLVPFQAAEEAEKLLANPAPSNHGYYVNSLSSWLQKIEDEDLVDRVEGMIAEHEVLAERENQQRLTTQAQQGREAQYEDKAEDALQTTQLMFELLNPQATINWMTTQSMVIDDGTKIFVSFEYSVVNAFGTRVQRKYSVWWNYEMTEIISEQDDFLHFRN